MLLDQCRCPLTRRRGRCRKAGRVLDKLERQDVYSRVALDAAQGVRTIRDGQWRSLRPQRVLAAVRRGGAPCATSTPVKANHGRRPEGNPVMDTKHDLDHNPTEAPHVRADAEGYSQSVQAIAGGRDIRRAEDSVRC